MCVISRRVGSDTKSESFCALSVDVAFLTSLRSRNGLRYHYEHCGPHGVVGIQLFAEERHPRPEGQGGAELDVESENESAISSSAAYSPLPLSTASPALSSKPVRQRPPVRPRRVISTALPLSRIPPTFNDTLLAAQGTEARRPLLVRLDHLCERVGITRAGQAVVCLFCTEEGGTGFEYQWAELEKHMFKQHGYGFEKYCCMTNAERKEVKDGLDQVKALGSEYIAPRIACKTLTRVQTTLPPWLVSLRCQASTSPCSRIPLLPPIMPPPPPTSLRTLRKASQCYQLFRSTATREAISTRTERCRMERRDTSSNPPATMD